MNIKEIESEQEDYFDSESRRFRMLIKLIVFTTLFVASVVLLVLFRNDLFSNLYYYLDINQDVIKSVMHNINDALMMALKNLSLYLILIGLGLFPIIITLLINVITYRNLHVSYSRILVNVIPLLFVGGFLALAVFMFRTNPLWAKADIATKVVKLSFVGIFFLGAIYIDMGLDRRPSLMCYVLIAASLFCYSFLPAFGSYLWADVAHAWDSVFKTILGMIILYGGIIIGMMASVFSFAKSRIDY